MVAGEGFEPSKAEPGDLQSSASAIGLWGRQANLRLFTRKSHIFADISKDEEVLHLVSVLKVCQLKNEVSGIPKFGSPPSLFQR